MFCQLFILFLFFLCTSGLSQEEFRCVHNDNKVLELELEYCFRVQLFTKTLHENDYILN